MWAAPRLRQVGGAGDSLGAPSNKDWIEGAKGDVYFVTAKTAYKNVFVVDATFWKYSASAPS